MMNYIRLDSVDSTNNQARRLLDEKAGLPDFTVITTEEQTAGRGQQGNSWESERGKNLSFSIVCTPAFVHPAKQYVLSECIALAVQRALKNVLKSKGEEGNAEKVSVKWPNDIYYGDKKISGTLIECDLMGKSVVNCIIGTGVNVNQQRFVSDAPNPISLYNIIRCECDREGLLNDILKQFYAMYEDVKQGKADDIHSLYLQSLYRKDGRSYEFIDENGRFKAQIHDVEPSGRMILLTDDGERRRYEFKEVKFVL